MIDYDFSTLNDKEFENLTIDLISKERTQRYERFKSGRDGGIDGRFYNSNGTQEIVQCKHYQKTGFSGLISSLKRKSDKGINEIDKVTSLNPTKYIFLTSIQLSADNKKTIKELFSPYIINDDDIYGQEDLNQILDDNPDIEKRYYKLWLSSTVVLDRIFNNAIESRSEFLLEDIKENVKYYVETDNHNKAIAKLENSHIIIIAGEPGIGKTTLAKHISLWYIEKDFKFYDIEDSINDALNIYKKDEKQIFYFDDFLGSNYLNAIEGKVDSKVVKFIDMVKRDKTKRFILTSRTNIFNQGLALSDTFKSKNIESEEFIIEIDTLKDIDKAMILYNHVWHSDLDEAFIDEIYIDKRYKQIIRHKNFYPRTIEYITDIKKIELGNIDVNDYWNYIYDKLDNPQDIWEKAFDKDSDEFTRIIVMLVVFNGNKLEENQLQDAYNKYIELSSLQNGSNVSKEFDSIVKEVVKYFLTRTITYNKIVEYSLFNPSIADFVLNKLKNNEKILTNIFLSLKSKKSLNMLVSLNLDSKIYKNILFETSYTENSETGYLVKLINLMYDEFEEDRLDDLELLGFEKKIHEILNILVCSDYRINNQDINLIIDVVLYPYYTIPIDITPKLLGKLIFSTEDYIDRMDLEKLFYFMDAKEISLRDKNYKNVFIKLKNITESYLFDDYDKPNYPNNDTLNKIEQLLIDDMNKQTKEFINKKLEPIEYSYNNSNMEYLRSRLNYQKVKNEIVKGIKENIEDRLNYEFFKDDNKKENSDVKKSNFEEITVTDERDEIDELFQR